MFFRAGILIAVLSIHTSFVYASESSGTITPGSINAKVCHSVGCITPTPGVINFKPTGTTPVTIDDTNGIDGIAWGNEMGWITFDPTGPQGLTINTTTGVISGKAWSQAAGWVNFAPTGQSVTITSAGEFSGWAWAGGPYGGWIKFDCTDGAACVKTDWRPIGSRTVTTTGGGGNGPVTGSGGGGGSPSDVCWNVNGIQFDVPLGYTQVGNMCQVTNAPVAGLPVGADMCLNIADVQPTVPAGMIRDTGGLCVLAPKISTDTDGDGVPDTLEQGDSDQDSVPDYIESNVVDTDGDGTPNYLDADDDGDGYPTSTERTETSDPLHTDFDGDGVPSYLDAIFNPRRILPVTREPQIPSPTTTPQDDIVEKPRVVPPSEVTPQTLPQTDSAFEQPAYAPSLEYTQGSSDADQDGIPDSEDPVVAPAANLQGGDSDGDGITDATECSTGYPCADTNMNGTADYLEAALPQQIQGGTGSSVADSNVESDEYKEAVVHLSFIPTAVQIPIDAPAFREAFRTVLGTRITSTLLSDANPAGDSKVDLVSLAAIIATSSTVTFATLYTVLRVVGILALFI